MNRGLVIALLGAESTGKTTLSNELAQALREQTGLRCAVVDEHLRTWCEQQQRTPLKNEQRDIAAEQHRRIHQAAATHDVVIADTTALMIAVYSHLAWADESLDDWATELHAHSASTTLLTALDLPWVADGLQREGPHVQAPVDARLRKLLLTGGIAWSTIGGAGAKRLHNALNAVTPALRNHPKARPGLFTRLAQRDAEQPVWQAMCEHCDDPQCEKALHTRRTPSNPKP